MSENRSTPLFQELRETNLCQRWDDAVLTIGLPAETPEWADEALREADLGEVSRDEHGVLIVTQEVGGNCGAVQVAASWLSEIEDALRDCDVDPAHLILRVEGIPKEVDWSDES